jgi:hypothetical protein
MTDTSDLAPGTAASTIARINRACHGGREVLAP